MSDKPDNQVEPTLTSDDARTRRVEGTLSVLLRTGVILSSLLVVAGIVMTFTQEWGPMWDTGAMAAYRAGSAGFPHSLPEVATAIGRGEGRGVVMLGVLVLILTPIARVAASLAAFVLQRDRTYVWITLGVLGFLVVSFFVGKMG